MLRRCLIVAAMFPSIAQAAVPALCADAPNQAEGVLCAASKLKAAETAMERTYTTLAGKLDPVGKRNLGLAQAAWRKFRDVECDLETGNDALQPGSGGSIMPMLLEECAVSLTEQRTRDLAEQVKCPGGDLACEK